jgi:hypothetical protein
MKKILEKIRANPQPSKKQKSRDQRFRLLTYYTNMKIL